MAKTVPKDILVLLVINIGFLTEYILTFKMIHKTTIKKKEKGKNPTLK